MKEQNGAEERLVSWKEISAFLGVDERTCQRWEKRYGLPPRLPDYAWLKDELAAGIRHYDGRTKAWINRGALSNPR